MDETLAQSSLPDRIAFYALGVVIFLLPFFFIPATSFPFQLAKVALITTGVLVAFFFWIIGRIKHGSFSVPWSPLFASLIAIPIIAILSTLFSGHISNSFLGQGIEIGTSGFILISTLFVLLLSELYSSKEKIFYAYAAFIIGFFIVALFQLLRLAFGAQFLVLGNFSGTTANLIGKWNDLGIYAGLGILLSLMSLELLELSKLFKWILYVAIVIGFFFTTLTDFYLNLYFISIPGTVLIGAIALIIFVHVFFLGRFSRNKLAVPETSPVQAEKMPVASLLVIVLSIIFVLAGNQISSRLNGYFNITNTDTRPSWQATMHVGWQTVKSGFEPALFGVGPNRFGEQWLVYKPSGTNITDFWNTEFAFGIGYIPSMLVTTGILGILSWIVFLVFFVWAGFKAAFSKIKDHFSFFLLLSSFIAALYLWIIDLLYIPSVVTLGLTFVFTGLFFASLIRERLVPVKTVQPFRTQRVGFSSMFVMVILLIGTIVWAYTAEAQVVSVVYTQKALESLSSNDLDQAQQYLLKSISLDSHQDYVYQYLAQIALSHFNQTASDTTLSKDSMQNALQGYLSFGLAAANQAIAIDSSNYENYVVRGNVYAVVVPLGQANAYASAKADYMKAIALSPNDPSLYLDLANLELANKNVSGATTDINQALQLKPNYLDAISLLAQIDINQGDTADALTVLQNATAVDPNDPTLYFQIGSLRYGTKDYQGASSAFAQALVLDSQYSNAEYYLGLSYENLGRTQDALTVFQDLLKKNPNNQTIEQAISGLGSVGASSTSTTSKKK